jgi:adenylylsulfate kinase
LQQNVEEFPVNKNIVWHEESISREDRAEKNGHKSVALWFTGLSGAGKSTVAQALQLRLFELGHHAYVLDGDNVRHGLCSDLGFSDEDRHENIRRIGEMVKLFVDSGTIAISAFISPFRSDRDRVRALFPDGEFMEVYCRCSLSECEHRDVKGMYKKARAGLIKEFTGISSPYEEPAAAEIELDTESQTVDQSVEEAVRVLVDRGIIPAPVQAAAAS